MTSREAIQSLSETRREPAWLKASRLAAWEAFDRLEWPDRRQEIWRRTDIQALGLESWTRKQALQDLGEGDGRWASLGEPASRPPGVFFGSLEEALSTWPEVIQRFWASPPEGDKPGALHAAVWTRGIFLYVPPGVVVRDPFRITYLPEASGRLGVWTLVVLDQGASAEVIETLSARHPLESGAALVRTNVFLGEGARLLYAHANALGPEARLWNRQDFRLRRGAALRHFLLATGGKVSKGFVTCHLSEPGAESRLAGVILGDADQHFDYDLRQDHTAPSTVSDLFVKSALQDRARSVLTGLVRLSREAQKSQAFQTLRTLLLSPHAKADAVPKLEIIAHDVQCGHAAAAGPVDEEARFYLRSRGLSPEEAERMLRDGFLEEIFQRLDNPSLQDEWRQAARHKWELRQGAAR